MMNKEKIKVYIHESFHQYAEQKKAFPDYIDYLPEGCIVRKICVRGYLPECDKDASYIAISQDEYTDFVEDTIQYVVKQFVEKKLV